MRRRYDLRRLPLGLVFGVSSAVVLWHLLSGYWWMIRHNAAQFSLYALELVPVALFFGAMATLVLWYLLRIALPGIIRYRRLRQIRFYRASRRINPS